TEGGVAALDQGESHVGPVRMAEAPRVPSAQQPPDAEKLAAGASRDDLLRAYGSCLTRQTWFRGEHAGPTTELFHVAADCRERFTPRVFTVANGRVARVTAGQLDGVMLPGASGRGALESERVRSGGAEEAPGRP
ncbi:MAG: hypothetical protein ACYC8T_24270, partial [Myxococcaceae bacterium]